MVLRLALCCLVFAPAPFPQRHREPQLHLEGTWDELGGSWRVVTFWPGGRYESHYGKFPGAGPWVGWWTLSGRRLTVWQRLEGETWEDAGSTWSVELDGNLSGLKEWPGGTKAGHFRLCKP